MSTKRYELYKVSGVEWLGNVPSHWRVDRLKASIHTCRNGIWGEEALGDENDIPCVRVADFDRRRLRVELSEPTIRNVTEKERIGRVLRQGDLLLEKSGGGENQPVGCVVLYDDARPAVCSNFVARMVSATGQDSSYWRYVHAAAYAIRLTVGSINQTSGIQNLDQARYFNEYAVFPPQPEQAAIAAFLDRETGKIDALVEEQRCLIELLKEKRKAVISRAVTKGLNPNAPMKDSAVEWLGTVPAHWSVTKLKHLVIESVAGPYGASLTKDMYTASGYRVYGQQQVIPDDFEVGDYFISEEKFEEMRRYSVFEGDVLVSVMGTIGKVAVVPGDAQPGIINPRLVRYRCSDRIRARFLQRVLLSQKHQDHLLFEAKGTTMDGLNMSTLGNVPVLVPPIAEQASILESLADAIREIDELVAAADHAADLLRERRAALISAAVTGKIDVRDSTDLLTAWAETKADIAAGRFVSESAKAHVARDRAMAKRDD